jgi:hypothetical protein
MQIEINKNSGSRSTGSGDNQNIFKKYLILETSNSRNLAKT